MVFLNDVFICKNEKEEFEFCESYSLEILKYLTSQNDVYLISQVTSDIEEVKVVSLLEKSGLLNVSSRLTKEKILFCETDEGPIHMTRQLSPQCFIDQNASSNYFNLLLKFFI